MTRLRSSFRRNALPGGALLLALAGCAHAPGGASTAPSAAPGAAAPQPLAADAPAWVELGPAPLVRAILPDGEACPPLSVDDRPQPMARRVGTGTPARRPSSTKAADFPVQVCEATLAPDVRAVRLGGRALPVPAAEPRRIVVLGDTGCRIKGDFTQDCASPDSWPFAQVARTAAALQPDVVIHVGDYHYRETPCPAGHAGCADSPWGYGWDAWSADFFVPARPLLAAAPWIFVRGNHEECARAGQGWFRFLAPEPWTPRRSCDAPADDGEADYTPPYAVPLGATTQLVVFDSAHAGYRKPDLSTPAGAALHAHYVADVRAMDALASPGRRSWFASHHPVLGFAPDDSPGATRPYPGTAALLQAMNEVNGEVYFPPGMQLALHGHVHLFQALSFLDGHPATLVAGNGGDVLDAPLPAPLPPGTTPAPGVRLGDTAFSNGFGFLLMERADDAGRWTVTAFRRDGSELTHCALSADGQLACVPHGALP